MKWNKRKKQWVNSWNTVKWRLSSSDFHRFAFSTISNYCIAIFQICFTLLSSCWPPQRLSNAWNIFMQELIPMSRQANLLMFFFPARVYWVLGNNLTKIWLYDHFEILRTQLGYKARSLLSVTASPMASAFLLFLITKIFLISVLFLRLFFLCI